jgi:hypothetical protein
MTLIRNIRAEWRFDKQEGWTLRTRLFNAFYITTHALLPKPVADHVCDVLR